MPDDTAVLDETISRVGQAPAWHDLGKVLGKRMTSEEAQREAYLAGWNVRKVPIIAPSDLETVEHWRESKDKDKNYPIQGKTVLDVSEKMGQYLILRDHPVTGKPDLLSIMGSRYTPVQNEEAFEFIDALLDTDKDAYWETAGAVREGRVVFGCLHLPESTITLDPNGAADKVNIYLMVVTSHDGTFGVTAAVTPVRVWCENTIYAALRQAKNKWSIRHTQNVGDNMAEAKRALGITYKYADAFEQEIRKMYEAELSDQRFIDLLRHEKVFGEPDPDSQASQTRWNNKAEELLSIYKSDTCENVYGTVWGGYNAIIEYLDWHRTPRAGNVESLREAAAGFTPSAQNTKQDVYKAAKQLVTAA